MSFSPYDPGGIKPPRDRKRALLALIVLVVGLGGLSFLAINLNDRSASGVTPSPSAVAVVTATSSGKGGLNVPPLPTPTPNPGGEVPTVVGQLLTPTASIPSLTPTSLSEQALSTLDTAKVPARDLNALTARLRKIKTPISRTTDKPAGNYTVGHEDVFNASNISEKNYYKLTAKIVEVTDHAYWYVENGNSVSKQAIQRVSSAFEKTIYPTDRKLFGSEWTPGVDNDPRITVLFLQIAGAGGYYSSADEYVHAVNRFSNEREIIYIDVGNGGNLNNIEGVLAHEFQHMIHWHEHSNHDVWLNEGASVLAADVNGYDIGGVDSRFMGDTNIQLTTWQSNPSDSLSNYGASFLFLDYLKSHYGGDRIISSVVAADGQGPDAIDKALGSLDYKESFTDVFKKWIVANLVDGLPGASDKGLDYPDREVQISPQTQISSYPKEQSGQVAQFGADYVELQPRAGVSSLHVDFSGQTNAPIVSTKAHSGTNIWWSNRGDVADTKMTRSFDLRGQSKAKLNFAIWYDVEDDLDYGYVEASTDGGATWDTLKGTHTTSTNPNGTNFGNGYTGRSAKKDGADSNGWLPESIDLSVYAGKEILLRIEYITDDGYNAQGIAIDDISIPEIGYTDGAESEGGWQYEGFVRVPNQLDQRYFLTVVKFKDVGFDLQPVEVQASGKASFVIDGLGAGGTYTKAVLTISGVTPHSVQRTSYNLSIQPVK